MKNIFIGLFCFFSLCSCKRMEKREFSQMVSEWRGKEIVYPKDVFFSLWGQDTLKTPVRLSDFTIVSYVDSAGCISCKLQLMKWKSFILEIDFISKGNASVHLFFHPQNIEELIYIFKRDNFNYPVCVDINDNFNKLNDFPTNTTFQTFLLNRENRVLAIGNPIHNPKVKELYLKIIRGEKVDQENESSMIITNVEMDSTAVSLGTFNWEEEQKVSFAIRNVGSKLLAIQDVSTSCGCTSVSYSQEPVQPGKELRLEVTYKADRPEYFSKTITVYCNAESSPIKLRVSGNAK